MQSEVQENTAKERKVMILRSMKVRILLLVIGAIAATAAINLLTGIPMMEGNITSLIQNYMRDLAKICGENIDREVDFAGEEAILSEEELSKILGGVNVEGLSSSYCYAVSPDGILLYHPDQTMIGKTADNDVVQELAGEMNKGSRLQTDVMTYEYRGVKKYASYYMGKNLNYLLVVTADEQEAFATIHRMTAVNLAGAFAALLLCGGLSVLIAFRMTKPVEKITGVVERLSDLDFTGEGELKNFAGRADETGVMSQAAVSMQEKLGEVLRGLKSQSRELFHVSDEMNENADKISSSVEQVERAVTEIADGAVSQAQDTQAATEHIMVMGDMILATNKNVEDLRKNAREMRSAGEKASEILGDLSEVNQQTKEVIQAIYEQTTRTNESVAEIKKATDIITDIAEETNLLSLNASIEAARAGEAGRGFAVVASQIQQLADQSNASASQIDATISSLIGEFDETMKKMETVRQVIEKQDEDVAHTEQAFKSVREGISRSIDDIRSIATKVERLDEARVKVVDIVQSLTAIAQENAASTEETSATVAEVNSITSDLAEIAKEMHTIADELDGSIRQFRFDE